MFFLDGVILFHSQGSVLALVKGLTKHRLQFDTWLVYVPVGKAMYNDKSRPSVSAARNTHNKVQ